MFLIIVFLLGVLLNVVIGISCCRSYRYFLLPYLPVFITIVITFFLIAVYTGVYSYRIYR